MSYHRFACQGSSMNRTKCLPLNLYFRSACQTIWGLRQGSRSRSRPQSKSSLNSNSCSHILFLYGTQIFDFLNWRLAQQYSFIEYRDSPKLDQLMHHQASHTFLYDSIWWFDFHQYQTVDGVQVRHQSHVPLVQLVWQTRQNRNQFFCGMVAKARCYEAAVAGLCRTGHTPRKRR